jgi:hypothetical protein
MAPGEEDSTMKAKTVRGMVMALALAGCGGKSPAGGPSRDGGGDAAAEAPTTSGDAPADLAPADLATGDLAPADLATGDLAPAADTGDAASTGDATGAGDTAASLVTARYRACVAYFRAQCNRPAVCAGLAPVADPCPTVTDGCPDSEFAPGSLRTPSSLLACAQDWTNFACADLAAGKLPACAGIGGSLTVDAPCTNNLQCASTYCGPGKDPLHKSCGACTPRAPSGGACVAYGDCPYDEQCLTGTCTKNKPALMAAAACTAADFCAGPNTCRPAAGGGMTCQALPKLGDACTGLIFCADSLCTAAKKCEATPTLGMPCKRDAVFNRFMCDAASTCDEAAAAGPTCVPRTTVGGACIADARFLEPGTCAADLVCACVDAACTTGACRQRRQEGDACAEPAGLCVPGTTCVASHCAAVSQDVMTKRCGP